MFKVQMNRKKTYVYDKDGIRFELYFEFPVKEDQNLKRIFSALGTNELGKKNEDSNSGAANLFLYNLRCGLKGWSDDIVDENDKTIPFSEEAQKFVFDSVTNLPEVLEEVSVLYTGPTEKNSSSGVTQ